MHDPAPLVCPQSSYISGIASGANVDQSWVSIVGVNSASSVNVNTQARTPDPHALPQHSAAAHAPWEAVRQTPLARMRVLAGLCEAVPGMVP